MTRSDSSCSTRSTRSRRPTRWPDGYIDLGYRLPRGRGQGWFRKLYERIEAEARQSGMTALATHASLAAEGAFLAMRFDVTEREVVALNGQSLERCAMEKTLRANP